MLSLLAALRLRQLLLLLLLAWAATRLLTVASVVLRVSWISRPQAAPTDSMIVDVCCALCTTSCVSLTRSSVHAREMGKLVSIVEG